MIAVIWRLLLDPAGVLNYVLHDAGHPGDEVNWLGDPSTALWALTFANIWSGYPFFMISLLAGLQGIPGRPVRGGRRGRREPACSSSVT